MTSEAEKKVSRFYNTVGWKTVDGITVDARDWEDLRDCAKEYVSKCRLRVLRHIPINGQYMLDMASGPIQYKEYLEYSKNYKKRYCIDLSAEALDEAKKKIGNHGVFLQGSFFDIPLERDFFDCTVSLHTIYHVDEEKQEEAVRKLISVTKPGKPVIIVYSNPRTLISFLVLLLRPLRKSFRVLRRAVSNNDQRHVLYFFCHPITWWGRFHDAAEVRILPWRSFASNHQKVFIPDNELGKKVFDILFRLEEWFPKFFAKYFQYTMIVLTKRS